MYARPRPRYRCTGCHATLPTAADLWVHFLAAAFAWLCDRPAECLSGRMGKEGLL